MNQHFATRRDVARVIKRLRVRWTGHHSRGPELFDTVSARWRGSKPCHCKAVRTNILGD